MRGSRESVRAGGSRDGRSVRLLCPQQKPTPLRRAAAAAGQSVGRKDATPRCSSGALLTRLVFLPVFMRVGLSNAIVGRVSCSLSLLQAKLCLLNLNLCKFRRSAAMSRNGSQSEDDRELVSDNSIHLFSRTMDLRAHYEALIEPMEQGEFDKTRESRISLVTNATFVVNTHKHRLNKLGLT